MRTKLTREHFEQRIDALYGFARQQGYTVTALGSSFSGRHHYLVQHAENFVEVTLTSQGGISVSTEQGMGSQGRISPQLLAWLEGEGLRYGHDLPFSDAAREYLSGDPTRPAAHYAPKVGRQVRQERGAGGGIARIRQVIPAQPGWFAVYALVPDPGEGESGFEMLPIIGWALLTADTLLESEQDDAGVVALYVWSAVDTGSRPDASPHAVLHERTGFLGYAHPGCTIDWEKVAADHRKAAWNGQRSVWEE